MKNKTIELSFTFYLGLIVLCGIMTLSFIYTIRVPDKQAERGKWVGHTREVISKLNFLEGHIYKAAFARSMKSSTLFTMAHDQVYIDLDDLKTMTIDNPLQQKNIEQLRSAIPYVILNPETSLQQLDAMREEEEALLIAREQIWETALMRTKKTIVASQLLLFIVTLITYQFFFRELVKRRLTIAAGLLEESRLHEIVSLQNTVTTSELDLNGVMKLVVDCSRELVKADGSVIEHIENGEMVFGPASGSGIPFAGMRIPIEGSFSGKSVIEQAILKCDDAEIDPYVDRAACKRVGVRSMVVVPLLRNGVDVFGVLKVFSSERAAFSDKDVNTMEIIAALLSARITDASIFSAMTDSNFELASQKDKLLYTNAELGELAATDGLTGLRNHRYFMDKLDEEFRRAQRYSSIFSIVLMDVDHFKKFNDSFGHVAGDHVLRKVGAILKESSRDVDVVSRYGGEEFAVLLPATGVDEAAILAERLRANIASANWEHRAITISVGVSTFDAEFQDSKALLESADQALYAAKSYGRNCVRGK